MGEELGRPAGLVSELDRVSARDVLEAAPDALIVVDDAGLIVQLNRPTAELFGYERGDLIGRPIEILIPEQSRALHVHERSAYHHEPRRRAMGHGPELHGLRKDGTEFPVEISLSPLTTATGTVVIAAVRDISARKAAEAERRHLLREQELFAEISRLAQHDPLTGLPNRALLFDRLASAIAHARRHNQQLAILCLDLDRFKHVNDSLGHFVGDRLLESVASRLAAAVRDTDTVSRDGGDEFVIMLPEVQHREEVAATAAKIIGAVTGSHQAGKHDLHVTTSVGIAMYPADGNDAETLIKNADVAMYFAKDQGRNNVQFFTNDMNARVVERQAVESSLRGALERGEFVLYDQPKVDLQSGALIGAEALLRWRHPERGIVSPEQFVPVAEDSGLIVPIGQWVLYQACRQAREWQDAGLLAVPIAVNISAIEFRGKGFLASVRRILAETGLEPRFLELELTESVLMESAGAATAVLRELKDLGVRLAVDDFGTGYSSLSYLTQFPIDALKVDQSFVREITSDVESSPIITAVISMGKSLNHRVIAEGVETQEQLAFLQAQQCEEGQGFHFSRPLEAHQFEALLEAASTRR